MTELLNGWGVDIFEPQYWLTAAGIIWINILLSGDNAIVIALACRSLPRKQRLAGMVLGTGVALVLRIAFTSIVVTLMFVPYLKIVAGAALFWISLKLVAPVKPDEDENAPAADSVMRAVTTIAIADIVMSLDNVIAVAAAAKGNFLMLMFGLGVSIPIIVGGATLILTMIQYAPIIVWAGAALLGWLAGDMIATDPVVVDAAKRFGPDAHEKIALACAILGAVGTIVGGLLFFREKPTIHSHPAE